MRILIAFSLITISLLSISCKKDENIGREVQVGNNDILLLTTDSFHISSFTTEAEPERTDERFEGMLGAYMDPLFGPNVISFHSQFHLEEEGFNFPNDAIFDSAFISFRLTGGYREKELSDETNSLMHFEVYEISEDLSFESQYLSDEQVNYLPNIVGEYMGEVSLFDSIKVDGVSQPAQIRIPLNQSWVEGIMNSDPSNFTSNASFTSFLKGLTVRPIQTNDPSSTGAIFYFSPLSSFTGVTIHYHTTDDTTKFSLITSSLTANFMTFEHDYASAPIGSILNDTAIGSDKLYLQSTIGTDLSLELKDIASSFAQNPKVINIAELFIPVDTTENYYPLPKLTVSRKLEDGTAELLPDQAQTGARDIDGSIYTDSSNTYYRFLITQYVQEIIHNYQPGSNRSEILIVSPSGNTTLANRSVVTGPRPVNSTLPKMRVEITYTPLN